MPRISPRIRRPAPHRLLAGVGALGLLATWGFHRWSRRPERAEFCRKLDHSLTGHSLRKAQALLDEVRDFGKE